MVRTGRAAIADGTGSGRGWLAPLLAMALVPIAAAAGLVAAVALIKAPSGAGVVASTVWLGLMAWLAHRESRSAPPLATIALAVAFAILLRAWGAMLCADVALVADPTTYGALARALLAGDGLIVSDWRYGEGLRAHWPPLYALVLAGWWAAFGSSLAATIALQALTSAVTAWLIYRCGCALGGAEAGRFAAMAFIAYPALALPVWPNKEALVLLLVVAIFRIVLAWLAMPHRWHGAALGGLWGLLTLGQPSWAVMPVAVAPVLAIARGIGPVMRLSLPVALGLILVLAPWWVRNALVFGEFVPLTTAGGYSFWVALGPQAPPFPADLMTHGEIERARIMSRMALDAIAADPVRYVAGVLRNAANALAYEEAVVGVLRHARPPIDPVARAAATLFLQTAWVVVLTAAAAGAWRHGGGRGQPVVLALVVILACLGAINIWLEFGERHRQLVTPFLLLLAGLAATSRPLQPLPTTLSGKSLPNTR